MSATILNTDVNHRFDRNVPSSHSRIELENVPSEKSYKSLTPSGRTPTLVEDVEAIPELLIHRPTGFKVMQLIKCS